MTTNPTYDALRSLKLDGMADVFVELVSQGTRGTQDPNQWISHMVAREKSMRDTKRLQSRLRMAKFREPDATMATVDFNAERTVDRAAFEALGDGSWIKKHRTV